MSEVEAWTVSIEAQDLVVALDEASSDGGGWIHAVGRVEGVELEVSADSCVSSHVLQGQFDLVSLQGPAGGPYWVTLSRRSDRGLEMVGGRLVRAVAHGVVALVFPATNLGALNAPVPPPAATWGGAAVAAADRRSPPEEEEERSPDVGDRVDHFAFGLCDVLMSDGESLRIRDAAGSGRVREIRLEKLVVLAPHQVGEHWVFPLKRRS